MNKPFMFTGLGLVLITAWGFVSSINWAAVGGCVAGYTLMDFLF